MITISPSQIRSMSCRQRWKWEYPDGYRPIAPNKHLDFGSAVHAALEYFYTPDPSLFDRDDLDDYFAKWMDNRIKGINSKFQDEIDEFIEMKALGIEMLKGYRDRWKGKDEFEVLATEKTLSRRLPVFTDKGEIPHTRSNCKVVVRLDGIVRCKVTGKIFSLEHKTFKRFVANELILDPQYTAQVWVGQRYADAMGLDEPVVGVIYNGLRKQKPGPRVKVALFERHKIFRNQHEIDSFVRAAYWQYRESRTRKIYPEPSARECSMCKFTEPCTEKVRGGDYQFLLDHNYTTRKERIHHGKKGRGKAKA